MRAFSPAIHAEVFDAIGGRSPRLENFNSHRVIVSGIRSTENPTHAWRVYFPVEFEPAVSGFEGRTVNNQLSGFIEAGIDPRNRFPRPSAGACGGLNLGGG